MTHIARASMSSTQFFAQFAARTWLMRNNLTEEERFGLFQHLYVTCCGAFESALGEYLAALLHWPKFSLAQDSALPQRSKQLSDGSSVAVDVALATKATHRLLERTALELASAPFNRLVDLHGTLLGAKVSETLGSARFNAINGLVAIRNVVAHSRSVYVDMIRDPAGGPTLIPESNFDSHPLKQTFQVLAQVGLYTPATAKRSTALVELLQYVYREDVVLFFWNAAREATDIYIDAAAKGGFIERPKESLLPSLAA